MGYVYLQPPSTDFMSYIDAKENKISKYIDPSLLEIPLITDNEISRLFEGMQQMIKPYHLVVGIESEQEYCNDLDGEGYMNGIELSLSKEKFIDLISNGAFKVYNTEWKGQLFNIATFDVHKLQPLFVLNG
ncbi:hypothetical protein [Brevibacillus sp. SYSU BS000544]|uniref:hypothetical protein n=1 Tax=Brevibacillus sp. SYSU BS000544 TaxID=3416443 RepID=UPI003CE4A33C